MNLNSLPSEVHSALQLYYKHKVALPILWENRPNTHIGVRLLEGCEPVSLAPGLTRREAGLWCSQDRWKTPATWLWAQYRHQWPNAPETINTNYPQVIRWLLRLNDEQRDSFLRTKKLDGEMVPVYGWSRLDELRPSDLVKGVEATFALAEDRAALERWKGPDKLMQVPKWAANLPEGVELITTFSRLLEEGREMRHCVATYANKIYRNESLIFSLQDAQERRSTAEVQKMRVIQHEGFARRTPSGGCVALLLQTIEVISRSKDKEDFYSENKESSQLAG